MGGWRRMERVKEARDLEISLAPQLHGTPDLILIPALNQLGTTRLARSLNLVSMQIRTVSRLINRKHLEVRSQRGMVTRVINTASLSIKMHKVLSRLVVRQMHRQDSTRGSTSKMIRSKDQVRVRLPHRGNRNKRKINSGLAFPPSKEMSIAGVCLDFHKRMMTTPGPIGETRSQTGENRIHRPPNDK